MSLEYIRRTYNVPAKRGMRIEYSHGDEVWHGRITSASGKYIRVLVDELVGGRKNRILCFHPTWCIEYIED